MAQPEVASSESALLAQATTICAALPEVVVSDQHPPHRGFVVGKKNFAWFVVDEHGDRRIGLVRDSVLLQAPKRLARHVTTSVEDR